MLITNLKVIHHTFHVNKKLEVFIMSTITTFLPKKLVILVADILHYVKNTLIIK